MPGIRVHRLRSKMRPLPLSLPREWLETKADGLLHKLALGWHRLRYRGARAQKYLRKLLYGLPCEVRSFGEHIRILISTKLYQEGLQIEPPPSLNGVPFPLYCKRVFACNQDIQNLAASHPGFGLVDFQTFAQGWKAGAEWAARIRNESADLLGSSSPEMMLDDLTQDLQDQDE